MTTPDPLASQVTPALAALLGHVREGPPDAPEDLGALVRLWFRTKAERSGAALAAAVGLEPAELAAFEAALRDVERTQARLAEAGPEGAPPEARNARIALVRLRSWLETLAAHVPLPLDAAPGAEASEDVGRKQARALELVVRALVREADAGDAALEARLREALGDAVVRRWRAQGDPDDLLSGCSFGELASLFASKEEFARYERLYADTPFLTLLKQRRRTLQAFLDDVRRIRNLLAHHKRVSDAQLTLLDLYYEEIVAPVQTAHDHGETRVDPSRHLDVSREELDAWQAGLREDVQAVREDLAGLREAVVGRLDTLQADATALRRHARGVDRRLLLIGAGVAGLLVAAFLLLRQGDETGGAAREAAGAAEASRAAAAAAEAASRETAARVETATTAATTATGEAAERVEAAAGRSEAAATGAEAAATRASEATERVAASLEDLRAGFAALAREGGVVVDADRPAAHYHNARVYEERGDALQAAQSYARYFATPGLEFIDPHLRYQALVRLQRGLGGARETWHAIRQRDPGPVPELAWLLLLDDGPRVEGLERFLEAHPDVAPAWYLASLDHAVARLGTPSLEDKRQEKALLEGFLRRAEGGDFLRWYLDPTVAAAEVEDAKTRLAALATLPEAVLENPVRMTASRSNQGWTLVFSIADTVKEILWRAGPDEAFRSTGFMPGVLGPGGLPLAKTYVELPGDRATVVQVKYVDPRDREHGPYDLPFDPAVALVENARQMLDLGRSSWLLFREMDDGRVLLYFTSILTGRIALSEIRYGLDREEPDRTFPFTPADPRRPFEIDTDAPLWLEVPPATRAAVVQLVYVDGTRSEVVRIAR